MRLALLTLLIAACGFGPADPFAAYDILPYQPGDTVWGRSTDHYPEYWAAMEACSGLRGNLAVVRWYVLADSSATRIDGDPNHPTVGLYAASEHAILLAPYAVANRIDLSHEMLHALGVRGHPAVFDLCGVR